MPGVGVKPHAIMVNPKTLELVAAYRKNDDHRISFYGDVDCIGAAYTAEERKVGRATYLRIHSPSDCRHAADFSGGRGELGGVNRRYHGKGFGLLLYAGTAIGVNHADEDYRGVFSVEGTRSSDADILWRSLVKHDVAEEHEGEEDEGERTEEENHCFPIPESRREVDDGGWVTSREVCGDVDVTYSGELVNVNTIDASTVVDMDFVLWADGWEKEEQAPADLVARVKVASPEGARSLAAFIRDKYDEDLARAFAQRPDVLELFGQERLPLTGPGRVARLPPLSRRTRDLIDMFRDAP